MIANTPSVHDVSIKGFAFEPEEISVRPGDIIRRTNADLVPHTATAKSFGWDTGKIVNGENVEVTVDMERNYFCAFHPRMKGAVKIE